MDQGRLGVTTTQQLDTLPWLSGCRAWGQVEADESKDNGCYLWWMIAAQNGYQANVANDIPKEDKKTIGFGKAKEFGYMELSSGSGGDYPDINNATKLMKKQGEKYCTAVEKLIEHHGLSSEPIRRDGSWGAVAELH